MSPPTDNPLRFNLAHEFKGDETLKSLINDYVKLSMYQSTGLTLNEFLDQPLDYVTFLLDTKKATQSSKETVIEELVNAEL